MASSKDRDKLKEKFIKKYKNKLKPEILEKNIDGLVDEYIENINFIKSNNLTVDSLPSTKEIRGWFEESIEEYISNNINSMEDEEILQVDIDAIYKKDKLARVIFKEFYSYKWNPNEELHEILKLFIKLYKISNYNENPNNKKMILSRLGNIAILGVVRFYHKERTPFFKKAEIDLVCKNFLKLLDLIYKVHNKKIKDINLEESIYIFDLLNLNKKDS